MLCWTAISIKNKSKEIERNALGFMQLNKSVFKNSQFKIRNLLLFNYLPKESNHLTRTIELPNETKGIQTNLVGCTEIIATDVYWICTIPWVLECWQYSADGCDHCGYPLCCWTSLQSMTITVCDNPYSSGGIPSLGTGINPSPGGGVSTTNPTVPCTGSGDIIGGLLPCGNPELGGWVPDKFSKNENDFYYTRINVLNSLLRNNPSILLLCDSLNALNSYGLMYQRVAQYLPPQSVLNRIDFIKTVAPNNWIVSDFNIQSLTNAYGSVVNCDFFPVRISQLPTGKLPKDLIEYFRKKINDFIDDSLNVKFSLYIDHSFHDTARFNAQYENSLGALILIHMTNDGSVIESEYYQDSTSGHEKYRFKFTTITTPLDFSHPVSDNREFGVYAETTQPGEYIFYTMGVDRTSDIIFNAGNTIFNGFGKADALWSNMQKNIVFILFFIVFTEMMVLLLTTTRIKDIISLIPLGFIFINMIPVVIIKNLFSK